MSGACREGSVHVGGGRLHLLEWEGGGGAPLLLLPGIGQSAHVYRELAPRLAAGRRVVALTPPGHGVSDPPAGPCTVAALARALGAAMDALGIARAALAAHSGAGAVAARFAADHPGRVERVILLDALADQADRARVLRLSPARPPLVPMERAGEAAWWRRHHPAAWGPALEADCAARPAPAERLARAALMAELAADLAREPPPYARLRAPVLALEGEETLDTTFAWLPPDDAAARAAASAYLRDVRAPWRALGRERFLREAPRGRVILVPGGHFFFLADPDAAAAPMRAFLSTPAPALP